MNVFQYATSQEACFEAMAAESGYQRKTTFYSDFSIGEFMEGAAGVKDTFNRAFKEWKDNVEYFTEMILALNWKSWYWHSKNNKDMVLLYTQLYEKAVQYVYDNWDEKGQEYYYQVTD